MSTTGIIASIVNASRFKDTVFIKEDSDLKRRFCALEKLKKDFPKNKDISKEYYRIKKGLAGEDEIAYQLKKSNIGMYVLRDVKVRYEDLTAQIDLLIITSVFTYIIESKNLTGNITVNEKGDFIRETVVNGKKKKVGMYSPLRQAEAQREVVRKIWEANTSKLTKLFASNKFDYCHRVLVVAANPETILNTAKAPKDIKYKVVRADGLIRQIQYDLQNRDTSILPDSRKDMEASANSFLKLCEQDDVDYYTFYKTKYALRDLRNELLEFRRARATALKMPPYYIFTDSELDNIVAKEPKSLDEIKKLLAPIKVKTHGEEILKIIER